MQDSTSTVIQARWSSGSVWEGGGWEGFIAVWPPRDGAAWSLLVGCEQHCCWPRSCMSLDSVACIFCGQRLFYGQSHSDDGRVHATAPARALAQACPTRSCIHLVIQWVWLNCLLRRCSLVRGFLCIEVSGETFGTFRIVHFIMGVHCWGVSVKRVP